MKLYLFLTVTYWRHNEYECTFKTWTIFGKELLFGANLAPNDCGIFDEVLTVCHAGKDTKML